jgi:hypothetical protein
MLIRAAIPAGCGLLAALVAPALAFEVNGCEKQRAAYPKVWSDVSHEKAIFDCASHYSGSLRVKLGMLDSAGRALMSIVPLRNGDGGGEVEAPDKGVYRTWLDREQFARLTAGRYFAAVVRAEAACWIRGDLDMSEIFFLDRASVPSADDPVYDKAPRISAFHGDAYSCQRTQ